MTDDRKPWGDNIEPVPALLRLPNDQGPLRGIERALVELCRPSLHFGPAVQHRGKGSPIDTRWCASLYGVQGYGPSPDAAMRAFDAEWIKVTP